jgi:hypothetical protein
MKWRYLAAEEETTDDPEKMSPKERLDYYKGSRERDNYRREAGELIAATEVTGAWLKIVGVVKARLMAVPMRIAPAIVAVDDLHEAEKTIKAEIVSALADLAGTE